LKYVARGLISNTLRFGVAITKMPPSRPHAHHGHDQDVLHLAQAAARVLDPLDEVLHQAPAVEPEESVRCPGCLQERPGARTVAGKRVSVMFGGMSSEHDVSLKGFESLYEYVRSSGQEKVVLDRALYVDTEGRVVASRVDLAEPAESYYQRSSGDARPLVEFFSGLSGNDEFVFSLLHGQFGEDGRVAALAELSRVRGSFGSYLACGLAMSKEHMHTYVRGLGLDIRIPRTRCLVPGGDIDRVFERDGVIELLYLIMGFGTDTTTLQPRFVTGL
jgi:hypothetical protein